MNIKSVLKMSFQSIFSNKMRTFLTMLGIIIGVFSVIVLISIGEGATASVVDSISTIGSNLISVNMFDRHKPFDYKDLDQIEELEGVKFLTPSYGSSARIKYDLKTTQVNVTGGNENYLEINNYEIASGRGISPVDVDYRNKIAVIGTTIVEDLFGKEDPIGKGISMNGEKYTVVGTLREKSSSMLGDSNKVVIVPATTFMRQNRVKAVSSITIQSNSTEESTLAKNNIDDYLLKYFDDNDSYNVFSQDEVIEIMNEITGMLTAVLGGIAGISLLVGGIGIMNIMLVTVTERTREIGIRKAIGAGRSNIMIQFLIESSVLSGLGGIVGMILGIMASSALSDWIGIKFVLNPNIIIGAFAFSLGVGLFFGLYPANKASKLNPVDALRYE